MFLLQVSNKFFSSLSNIFIFLISFNRYGPSGTIVNIDVMCLLPLNILNDKIYFVLSLWYVCRSFLKKLLFRHILLVLLGSSVYYWEQFFQLSIGDCIGSYQDLEFIT